MAKHLVVLAVLAACLQAASMQRVRLSAQQDEALQLAGFAPSYGELVDLASSRFSGLVSDDICRNGPVSCGGACSNTVVTCTRIPTGSGDVWLNTGNSTCAKSGYCVNGECQEEAPAACAEPQPTKAYECSAPGYFPDVTSCSKYYFCTADRVAYGYDCAEFSSSTYYDQRTASCVPSSAVNTCTKLTCSSGSSAYPASRIWVYSAYPNVYAVCRTELAADAIVAKCPDNKVMNTASGQCEDGCLEVGRYRPIDAEDDRTYVECVQVYSGSSSTVDRLSPAKRRLCPGSSFFDPALGQCNPIRPPPPTTTTEAPTTAAPTDATSDAPTEGAPTPIPADGGNTDTPKRE